jgi:hypothetical protein
MYKCEWGKVKKTIKHDTGIALQSTTNYKARLITIVNLTMQLVKFMHIVNAKLAG